MLAQNDRFLVIPQGERTTLWDKKNGKSAQLPIRGPFVIGCLSECHQMAAVVAQERINEHTIWWMHIFFLSRRSKCWFLLGVCALPWEPTVVGCDDPHEAQFTLLGKNGFGASLFWCRSHWYIT